MDIYDKLFIFWLLSGIIESLHFIFFISKSERWEDKVRDIVWNTGVREDFIYQFTVFISFVFGIFFLTYGIIYALIGKKKGS